MLIWTRERDGEKPNGSPCYEYRATGKDGVKYHIVWAYDHGGSFGWTANDAAGEPIGRTINTRSYGIHWCRSLSMCQDICNEIERGRTPLVKLVPNWAGEFSTFEDWVNNATRKLSGKFVESSTCTYYNGGPGNGIPATCVDTKGRRCVQGSDFERARKEGCFPVRFFWDCKPE